MNTNKLKKILYLSKMQYSKYTFVWKKRYVVFSSVLIVQASFE